MTETRHDARTPTKNLPERRYLPELHGVRGLALLGVVLFHLFGSGRISGGIDIFLAVSGYLFTGMLLREAAAKDGRIDAFRYLGRLIRRIFVPAAFVATVTLAAGLLISPVTQHRQLWAEARASLLYFENLELISSQLAYGAAGPETSPFQHFWSLSVQGQFYLIWPLIAIAAVAIAKAAKISPVRVMTVIVSIILAISFVYAMYVGSHNQNRAYLMTTTRAWQLAFGGLLALAGVLRLPKPSRGLAGWVGVALIVTCGFFLDGAQLFPGPWALWPLAGLTLVLIAAGPEGGNNDPVGSATHFLSNPLLAWVGDRAYGLYLWHWPLLIYYLEVRDREAIGMRGALVILAASTLLAALTYRYIEQPLQRITRQSSSARGLRSNRSTVAMGAGLMVIVGVATSASSPSLNDLQATYEGLDQALYPGAAQYWKKEPAPDATPFPSLDQVDEFRPDYTKKPCAQKMGQDPGTDEVTVCEDESAPADPTATIVLAGGSHAGHLEAAFKALGRKYGWEVLVVTKSSCVFGWEEERPDETMCGQWNENFITWLDEHEVDLVVTPGTRLNRPEYVLDAAPKWWEAISSTGTDLMLVRGIPRAGESIPDCLASGGSAQDCGPSKENFADTSPLEAMRLPDNVHPVDVTKYVCPQIENEAVENCDAIVGNMVVWYDNHHFTTPFSQSLAPAFEAEMQKAIPHLLR